MFTTVSHTASRAILGTVGTMIFAGACLFGATAPAAAAESKPRVAHVGYKDLDTGSEAGRKALSQRIKAAARNVCYAAAVDAETKLAEADCKRNAIAAARAQMVSRTVMASN